MKSAEYSRPAGWTIALTVFMVLAPSDAWAYVDPGAGSYMFQLAAAAMLAGMYLFRQWSSAVLRWCTRLMPWRTPAGHATPPSHQDVDR